MTFEERIDYLQAHLRIFLTKRDRLFPLLHTWTGRDWGNFCDAETDLCIEGYESSANSFVVNLFAFLTGDTLRLGHHKHVIANVKRALRYDVPTLILYRDPADCIPSMAIRFRPDLVEATLRYVHFYQYILTVRRRLLLSSFEEVTTNVDRTIQKVTLFFGIDFGAYSAEEAERVAKERVREWTHQYGTIDNISLPTEKRSLQKNLLRDKLSNLPQYKIARQIYEEICNADKNQTLQISNIK